LFNGPTQNIRTSNIHEIYDEFKLQTLHNFPYKTEIEEIFLQETNVELIRAYKLVTCDDST